MYRLDLVAVEPLGKGQQRLKMRGSLPIPYTACIWQVVVTPISTIIVRAIDYFTWRTYRNTRAWAGLVLHGVTALS